MKGRKDHRLFINFAYAAYQYNYQAYINNDTSVLDIIPLKEQPAPGSWLFF